ncbi:MgtC/SapB family protein [Candidatus Woesearchaeota archaeon]|nr:MgtC/SapB family protein [Candidatus Woesearchaeota archaeon]
MSLEIELITRLAVATVLGLFIGMEREYKLRFAGMRTNALVCLGSAAFSSVSIFISNLDPSILVRTDFARTASNIVVGVGFLGAGVIFKTKNRIQGLTTAANLWTVSAIGMMTGFGMYKLAVSTTALVLFLLVVVGYFERRFFPHSKPSKLPYHYR